MGKEDMEKAGGIKEESIGNEISNTTDEKEIIQNNEEVNGKEENEKNDIKYVNEEEFSNTNTTKEKNNGKKKIIIGSISLVIAILLISGIYYGVKINNLVKSYNDKVYPMSYILDKDISGMNKDQLHKTLEEILSTVGEKEIEVTIGDRKFEIARRALDLDIDFEAIENEVLNYGKDNKLFEKLKLIRDPEEKNYEVKLTYNEEAINEFIQKIATEVYVEPSDASININGGEINITDGQIGSELDSEKLTNEIKSVVEDIGGNDVVTLSGEIKDVDPNITAEALQSVNGIIGSYTTYFSAGPSGTNIALGALNIDNTLLMPGDIFSTVDAIGPTTAEYGFVLANTYVDGQVVPGYGGGVCQIATTLYNAELRSGIVPLERTNHMMTVGYAPIGLDATIGDYEPDLVFENPYEYPIVIKAYTSGGSLTVEFWSNTNATNGITYEPKAYPSGSLYAETYLYGYDADGNVVYEEYLNSSSYRPFS